MIEAKLKKWGNSIGVILPSEKLKKLGLRQGDKVEVEISSGKRINGFGIAKGAKPFKEEEEKHKEFW
jgi:antitoxin component of MazEF toxin-antitoxin module